MFFKSFLVGILLVLVVFTQAIQVFPRQQQGGSSGEQTIGQYLSSNQSFSILMQLVQRSPEIQALFSGGGSGGSSMSQGASQSTEGGMNRRQASQTSSSSQQTPSGGGGGSQKSSQQHTVFAPTNQAFQSLLSNQNFQQLSQNFTSPRADELIDFLLAYHIVNGTFNVTQQVPQNSNMTVDTILGFVGINVSNHNDGYWANDAKITDPQGIKCSDGGIYPIDGILTPLYFLGVDLKNVQLGGGGQGGSSSGTPSTSQSSPSSSQSGSPTASGGAGGGAGAGPTSSASQGGGGSSASASQGGGQGTRRM